ncbi:hypothetical protein [Melghirimyces algeriensis]|nr:hypothetical protein [Melghirimyces algeriensis]
MSGKSGALALEMVFVPVIIMMLKEWVYPFFIWKWFPVADTASTVLEWVLIVVTVIGCFAYIGFGSSARHIYKLSLPSSIGIYLVIHLPLVLPVILMEAGWSVPSLWKDLSLLWWGLIGDGIRLFTPDRWVFHPLTLCFLTALLFLCGRNVYVEEEESIKSLQQSKVVSNR